MIPEFRQLAAKYVIWAAILSATAISGCSELRSVAPGPEKAESATPNADDDDSSHETATESEGSET